ncbi:ester cyclase [Rubrobacter indicoceani]|uniref:ester cyclase n=1 Tax=Rubrobacter indicoceani TaxID=2051957 RepID=UPI000E5A5E6E|nr:ester cyclase [Rubrobacter indicoceani]
MPREANIKAQERFGEAVNTGNFDIFDEVVAPDAVDHDPAPGQGRGPEGFKSFFGEMRSAFPDFTVEVDHMSATDDDVAFAYRISGTHNGEFQGIAPTGNRVEVRGCQISRFEAGKLVERWGSSDELGLMAQLGVEPQQDRGFMDKLKDGLSGSGQ